MTSVDMLDDGSPLFAQIAEELVDEIADGALEEGARVPSTNELAAHYRINPATAARGVGVLVDDGLLEKRRGVGMFVAAGARERLLAARRSGFAVRYVAPMVREARRLGIGPSELIEMLTAVSEAQERPQ